MNILETIIQTAKAVIFTDLAILLTILVVVGISFSVSILLFKEKKYD